MKQRMDFVSNSSSSCFIVAIDSKHHDRSKWLTNTLRIQPDNKKVMMVFDDFSNAEFFQNDVHANWKFVCTQVVHWVLGGLVWDGVSNETKKKLMRRMFNSQAFIDLNAAVKEYLPDCEGIEFDEEDIRETVDEDGYGRCTFIPDAELDHESIFNGFEDMMEQSGCKSIAELIWGVKEIRIAYS